MSILHITFLKQIKENERMWITSHHFQKNLLEFLIMSKVPMSDDVGQPRFRGDLPISLGLIVGKNTQSTNLFSKIIQYFIQRPLYLNEKELFYHK